MQKKVWVVTLMEGLEVTEAAVFDNESDADNYAHEMASSHKGNYQVLSSGLNSRTDFAEEETHWAALPDFDAECMECLFEEISGTPAEGVDPELCAKFLEEHKVDFQKKADEIVHEYLRKELQDYLLNERIILG